jgi:hypothetical protein
LRTTALVHYLTRFALRSFDSILSWLGVNFTNMCMCKFYTHRSQKRKKTDKSSVYFVLKGSAGTIAARKTLVKSTLGLLNITDQFPTLHSYSDLSDAFVRFFSEFINFDKFLKNTLLWPYAA